MDKQQLASKIWESANKMRSKIEAHEYKDYILGFIFYKYLSENQMNFLKENEYTYEEIINLNEEDEDDKRYIQEKIGYFISYENLFSTWIKKGSDFDVSNVRDGLSAFNRLINPKFKKLFDKIFTSLETGLNKLGENTKTQTNAIRGLIELINDIPMDGRQNYDVIGFIYEYLIAQFAANAGKKAGEFYTPHEVSVLMSEIIAYHLKNKDEIKIYDPTSGSGSLLINIGESIKKYNLKKDSIKYYAQELKENTYNLTRMNLVMRGIIPSNIETRNGDTLEEDWPRDSKDEFEPLYVDAVVSNPPYSQNWEPKNKENEPRYARFGLAPKSKADYAFLLHDLYHIKPDGIMAIVLPHGVLFRGGEEGVIRKNLIEYNHIDTIIGLPSNIFFGTGIPTIIMILKQNRANDDILIIDASKGFIKEGKNNRLRECDIKKIFDIVTKRENLDKFSRVVSKEEIRNNEYNLNIPRYVDSSEKDESWDIYASMFGGLPISEINELKEYWEAFPNLKNELFENINDNYVKIKSSEIKEIIKNSPDINKFKENVKNSFEDFKEFLKKEWIDNIQNLNIKSSEIKVIENVFKRFENIPLINKYEAYQILSDEWDKISNDLEIIQSEGIESIKEVNPNIVIKKKDNKEREIQEGWNGKIIPFEIVQKIYLSESSKEIKDIQYRLEEISQEYTEIIENMTEDEKETEVLNDDGTNFSKNAIKYLKELLKEEKTEENISFIEKLEKYKYLSEEEKTLKKEIKVKEVELMSLTKETIENLTDEQVKVLLEEKWINNLYNSIIKLPKTIINNLVTKINKLNEKYETTLIDLEKEIKETEKILIEMIDELEANEYDKKGLEEFKLLLKGDKHE